MQNGITKIRSIVLTVLSIWLCCTLYPLHVEAEQQQRSITIDKDQEWGQIIVESNVSDFEVDIIAPDGTKWTHSEETDVDVLFYYSFETMRHWASESMSAGTYKVLIDGPADANYSIRNQNSFSHVALELTQPAKQTINVQTSSYSFDTAWSYTGDILRNNEIYYYLIATDGGEPIELGKSDISLIKSSISIPDNVIDGSYKLQIMYDNNTGNLIEVDPEVSFQVKRGFTGERISIIEIAPAAAELYAELNLPSNSIAGIEVALVEDGVPASYSWLPYELSELEELEADEQNLATAGYKHRYSLFVPVTENGSYKLAVRPIASNGVPGAITVSESLVAIQSKEWPESLVSWSIPDGVTNVQYGELSITYTESILVQLYKDGELVYEGEIDSANEPWVLKIPLSEGEHSYELVIYDDYGNYFTDGRIWTVDYTAPWLEMIGPLATHTEIPNQLVSGWTEKNVKLTINNNEVTIDEHGYFQYQSKANTVDIVVTDESGNETVYHWSKHGEATNLSLSQWIMLILGVLVVVGIAVYLFARNRRQM